MSARVGGVRVSVKRVRGRRMTVGSGGRMGVMLVGGRTLSIGWFCGSWLGLWIDDVDGIRIWDI